MSRPARPLASLPLEPPAYDPRDPGNDLLASIVRNHLPDLLEQIADDAADDDSDDSPGHALPDFAGPSVGVE